MTGRARSLLSSVLSAGLGRGAGLVAMALFAALLPLEAFGGFAQARAAVLWLGPALSLGLAASVAARLPQDISAGDPAAAAGRALLGAGLAGGLGCVAAGIWILGVGAEGAARGMAAALPAYGALFFGAAAARGAGRPAWAHMPLGAAALVAAAAFAVLAATGRATAEAAAWSWAAALTLAALAQIAALLGPLPRPRLAAPLTQLREGAPLTLSLLARGWAWQGPLLLAPWLAGAEAAGVLALALLAAQPALAAMAGVAGAAAPRLSTAAGDADWGGAAAETRTAACWGLFAALVAGGLPALAVWLAPGWAAALHGGLPAAAIPLALLSGAAAAQALEAPLGMRLIAVGRGRAETAVQVAGAIATGAMALTLAPVFGAAGAAAGTLVGAALRLVLGLALLRAGRRRAVLASAMAAAARPDAPDATTTEDAPEAPAAIPLRPTPPPVEPEPPLLSALLDDHARLREGRGGGARLIFDGLWHKTFRVVVSYRLRRASARGGRARRWLLGPPAALWHRSCCLSLGAEIAWQARIGPGLRILHGFGLVILPCARIGSGVTLTHGVIVGYRARPEAPTTPVSIGEVGDGAFVGPHAIVWARLGKGAVLAPHALLRDPTPDHVAVAGTPARVVRPLGPKEAHDAA